MIAHIAAVTRGQEIIGADQLRHTDQVVMCSLCTWPALTTDSVATGHDLPSGAASASEYEGVARFGADWHCSECDVKTSEPDGLVAGLDRHVSTVSLRHKRSAPSSTPPRFVLVTCLTAPLRVRLPGSRPGVHGACEVLMAVSDAPQTIRPDIGNAQ